MRCLILILFFVFGKCDLNNLQMYKTNKQPKRKQYINHRSVLNWSIIDRDNFIAVWFRIKSVDFDLTSAEKSANDGEDFIERTHVLQTGAKLLLYRPGKCILRSIQRVQKFSPHLQQLY